MIDNFLNHAIMIRYTILELKRRVKMMKVIYVSLLSINVYLLTLGAVSFEFLNIVSYCLIGAILTTNKYKFFNRQAK